MITSSFKEIQEGPLTDDVEAGIMAGPASIESGIVNEDTEERSFLERRKRLWNLVRAAAGVSSVIKNEEKKNNPEADEKKVSQEPPKDYIHVRARKGQAIDSHSLAERVRREKISERMKILQDLVPDCDKVTGKARMLDEIINYVRSLQNQVQLVDRERRKVDLEWIFVIVNFILELPSAVFDQLSSVRKPQFSFLSMVMSFAALFICIVELIYKCRKEKVTWKWRGTLPWLHYPSRSHKPFGSFKDIIGLVCAICQSIVTTINYNFCLQHADNPIKISVWPIIFAFGLLCSKFLGNGQHRLTDRPTTIEQK